MKIVVLILTSFLALMSCQSDNSKQEIIQLAAKIDSLEKNQSENYKPGLGTLMNSIQIHHLKLWKSGNAENWELVNFELHELEERFEDIEKYHPSHPETKQLKMIFSPIEELEKIAKEKDNSKFVNSFDKLTATCNSCHQLNEHPFIRITTPNSQNENQIFTP